MFLVEKQVEGFRFLSTGPFLILNENKKVGGVVYFFDLLTNAVILSSLSG